MYHNRQQLRNTYAKTLAYTAPHTTSTQTPKTQPPHTQSIKTHHQENQPSAAPGPSSSRRPSTNARSTETTPAPQLQNQKQYTTILEHLETDDNTETMLYSSQHSDDLKLRIFPLDISGSLSTNFKPPKKKNKSKTFKQQQTHKQKQQRKQKLKPYLKLKLKPKLKLIKNFNVNLNLIKIHPILTFKLNTRQPNNQYTECH